MTTQQETQTLEQTLNKTDFGHWVNENKKSILIAGAVVLAIIIGYSISDHMKSEQKIEMLNTVHDVKTQVFTPYLEDKKSADDFLKALNTVDTKNIHANLVVALVESLNKLDEKTELTMAHLNTSKTWFDKLSVNADTALFFGMRLAALFEDMKETKTSMMIYEKLMTRTSSLLKDQAIFHFARLNMLVGNKEVAKTNFDKVIADYKDSEFAKLAKIYNGRL